MLIVPALFGGVAPAMAQEASPPAVELPAAPVTPAPPIAPPLSEVCGALISVERGGSGALRIAPDLGGRALVSIAK